MLKRTDRVYAFIDSQNLNYGTKKDRYNSKDKLTYKGWKLDFLKFRRYLRNKFKVQKALLFIGYVHGNERLYEYLKACDFILVFKPTVKTKNGQFKGNVDAEIVLHAVKKQYFNYDKAIIVSGDGDFYCLYEELILENKLYKILIPNSRSASTLLKRFENFKWYLQFEKHLLEKK